jgi:hypothetical protein
VCSFGSLHFLAVVHTCNNNKYSPPYVIEKHKERGPCIEREGNLQSFLLERKEVISSYLRKPEKVNNIMVKSLIINKSVESLNIVHSSIKVSVEMGSFFSVLSKPVC